MADDVGAPSDEWDYLPRDDDLDTDPDEDQPAEEAALHVVDDRVGRAHDPGRSDVDLGDDDGDAVEAHYPDEDDGRTERRGREHEPDLEELLEAQHYAFGDEEE